MRIVLWMGLGCLAGLGCCEPPSGSEGWASYGHDQENSRANLVETEITADNVAHLEEKWRLPLVGCTSTPAVVDGVLYAGAWDGTFRAVDAATGAVRWQKQVASAPIDPSPLVKDGLVFFGDGQGGFHARRIDNGESSGGGWDVQLDSHEDTHIFSSAGAAGELVFVGVASTELVYDKQSYTFRGSLVALDAGDGHEVWRVYMTGDDATSGAGVSVWSSVAVDEARGRLFIGTGQAYEAPAGPRSDALVAIDYATGDVAWVRQFTADDVYTIVMPPPQGPDADLGAAPNLFTADGVDVVGVGDKAGVYAALDRDTGETVWAVNLTPGSHLGGVMNTAAVANGTVFVTSNHFVGTIVEDALDHPKETNTNTTIALDAADGTELWRTEQPYPSIGALLYAGGVVYHGSVDGTLHAMDAATGKELWASRLGPKMASGASLVNGRLYASYGFRYLTEEPIDGGIVAFGLGCNR